ncbi:MAG: VCBS repeat-containing protein [Zoogloea sp.]|nr:VCBS repeat-containing protein [Zoogloea sp.]
MKITSSQIGMTAQHAASASFSETESLRMWVGNRRPDFEQKQAGSPAAKVSISDAGLAAASGDAASTGASSAADATSDKQDEIEKDPKLALILRMIEMIVGHRIHTLSLGDLQQAAGNAQAAAASGQQAAPAANMPAGYGVEYDHSSSYDEHEAVSFQAQGTVKTADGKEISFNLSFDLARDYHTESSEQLRLGDAVRKDPLVLNFNGTAAQLTSSRFSFDLDADGKDESLPGLAAGSGFLVFDANANGKADNGSELFGPASGNGFADLAKLDADGNGWIDESDPAFSQLAVWQPGAGLTSLASAGVGAIGLANVATPYSMNDVNNANLGQLRASGVYLSEDGKAGVVQQVDLTA